MSRRKGQNPKVRVGKRADGQKYFFFQYWTDVPGQEERKRQTEVIGSTSQMTKSEAERKKLEFIAKLLLNSMDYQIPSSRTFADAVSHYREVFAPRMLRASTFSVADVHLKVHLEPDWKDVPVEHINIDSVNEWIWKKREQGLSWVTIKNILRTMQRVLSASAKDKKPPFSQSGLAIPERDKLQMKINSRRKVSFSWAQAKQIAEHVGKMETLGTARREQYSALFLLAAASGLRSSELFALRVNDLDFAGSTVRVEESSDQRSAGKIGPCKNVTAYRTVLLRDRGPGGNAEIEAVPWTCCELSSPRLPHEAEQSAPRKLCAASRFTQGSGGSRFAKDWVACLSTRLQPAMGTRGDQSRRYPTADGACIRSDDSAV